MSRKAQVKPRDWIVGSTIFILIIFGGTFVMANILSSDKEDLYNVEQFEAINNTLNNYDDLNRKIEELSASVSGITGSQGVFGFLDSIFNSAWGTITSLASSFDFLTGSITGLANSFLGIPPFVTTIFVMLITLVFVFGVLSIIFNREI